MAACKIVYQPVKSAVDAIGTSASSLKTAGDNFVTAFTGAIAPMQGAAKDALLKFFQTSVQPMVAESVPKAVEGMQSLLEANLDNFDKEDQQLAASIGGG